MSRVYAINETEKRKLKFLYKYSGIQTRYSVLPDYSVSADEWQFFTPTENLEPVPSIEKRMKNFREHAAPLSLKAINDCLADFKDQSVTHLITVSCTGMSAPGLDLELIELLNLPATTWRTSINFMGCYAAIHALKLADVICKSDTKANVLIVCVELCTLHFQKKYNPDNISSAILFSDGAAAMLVTGNNKTEGLNIDHFYSSVSFKSKQEMVWELSSSGFLMTLSGYIPELIEEDFEALVKRALSSVNLHKNDIGSWCIHPGGKRILESICKSLCLQKDELREGFDVLNKFGNMSSPTI